MSENLEKYELDASESTFTVQAFASGLLKGLGHDPTVGIRDFKGEAKFSPETFDNAELRIEVDARSLAVIDNVKEKDVKEVERTMHEDVLETSSFPEIVFQSTSITTTRIIPGRYKAKIIGDLTLHGQTQNGIWIMAQLTLDGDSLRAKGDFSIKQTNYGIKLVSVAAGALKLKDELKFNFDLVGRKQ
ncbi:MAG: YceI family protein [Pyrinomonadaceae bacterium]